MGAKKHIAQVTPQLSCLLLNHLLCPPNASYTFLAHQLRLSATGRKGGDCGSGAAALQAALAGASAMGRKGGSGGGHAAVLLGFQCPRGGEAGEQQQVCHGGFGVALLRWRWRGCGGGGAGERQQACHGVVWEAAAQQLHGSIAGVGGGRWVCYCVGGAAVWHWWQGGMMDAADVLLHCYGGGGVVESWGGGGRGSVSVALPGQVGSGVRLKKGSDNQHVVGGNVWQGTGSRGGTRTAVHCGRRLTGAATQMTDLVGRREGGQTLNVLLFTVLWLHPVSSV